MRNHRARDLVESIVSAWPDVAKVERVDNGRQGVVQRVTFVDGIELDLLIVNSSPPGGDNHAQPEKIVTKHDLAKR